MRLTVQHHTHPIINEVIVYLPSAELIPATVQPDRPESSPSSFIKGEITEVALMKFFFLS